METTAAVNVAAAVWAAAAMKAAAAVYVGAIVDSVAVPLSAILAVAAAAAAYTLRFEPPVGADYTEMMVVLLLLHAPFLLLHAPRPLPFLCHFEFVFPPLICAATTQSALFFCFCYVRSLYTIPERVETMHCQRPLLLRRERCAPPLSIRFAATAQATVSCFSKSCDFSLEEDAVGLPHPPV